MAATQKFIASGSRIVVARQNRPAEYYTTKKEIILAATLNTEACPITGDPVNTTTEQGIRLWFPTRIVRTRILVEAGDVTPDIYDHQLTMVSYDVPHIANYSPVAALYRVAVPMTESVWLVRTGDIPYTLIAQMEDKGAEVDVVTLDASETRSRVAKAIGYMQKKLAEAVRGADESIVRANAKLERSQEDGISEDDALAAYNRQIKAIETRLTKLRADVSKGASRFGLNDASFRPEQLTATARSVREIMSERAKAYTRATAALAAVGTTDATALANVAARDGVPVEVIAGALEDAGDMEGAAALIGAFADDNTFSLADAGE